jgi:hypothetical protein
MDDAPEPYMDVLEGVPLNKLREAQPDNWLVNF